MLLVDDSGSDGCVDSGSIRCVSVGEWRCTWMSGLVM